MVVINEHDLNASSPILNKFTVTFVKFRVVKPAFEHPWNALALIVVSAELAAILIAVNCLLSLNALAAILVRDAAMVRLKLVVKDGLVVPPITVVPLPWRLTIEILVQPLNALLPTVVTLGVSIIPFKPVHPAKALVPIVVVFPKASELRLVTPANALSPIVIFTPVVL